MYFVILSLQLGGNSCYVLGSCRVKAVSIFVFPNLYTTRNMKISLNRNTNTTRTEIDT